MAIIKRVGVLSVGKVFGVLYAILRLIAGFLITMVALLGSGLQGGGGGLSPMLFGVAAVVMVPLLYGAIGFIGGIIVAAVYNVVVTIAGGIELEIEMPRQSAFPVMGMPTQQQV